MAATLIREKDSDGASFYGIRSFALKKIVPDPPRLLSQTPYFAADSALTLFQHAVASMRYEEGQAHE